MWLFHISLLLCLWWNRPPFAIIFLIGKMQTFWGWNAFIYLGSIDSLLYIYCSIFNTRRIVLSKWCFRQTSDFSFLSLRIPDLIQRNVLGRKNDQKPLRTAPSFWKLFCISRKNILRLFCFHKLWSHNTLKGFLHSYLHWNLDFL